MKFIAHRVNTIEELNQLPVNYGVEIDLRDSGENIVLQHDPFTDGEDFEDYLRNYHHGLMILNIKSERIEHRVLELLNSYHITDYFFLDSSFPMIYLLTEQGERNIAVRFSELEGLDTVLNLKGKIDWVWVDCFTKIPLDKQIYSSLKEAGFKLCLVSPELQGRPEEIIEHKRYLEENNIFLDAVCTKSRNIDTWR